MVGDMSYPEWLITMTGDAIGEALGGDLSQTGADLAAATVLDVLGFSPEYNDWKRHNRVHADTEVWEGMASSPAYRERRRKALQELFRLEDEMEAQNADSDGTDSGPRG